MITSRALKQVLASVGAPRGAKRISAMVRVRNEEEFLRASLESVVEAVDEVVVIDNLSTDSSVEIAEAFRSRYPGKTRLLSYPHEIARPGAESQALATTRSGRRSPRSLATFYNWCMNSCTNDYILKWDGDMIALDEFHRALSEFRSVEDRFSMWFHGLNVHPNLTSFHGDTAGAKSIAPSEARVFPKRFARHRFESGTYEVLRSPYKAESFSFVAERPAYLHMYLCKRSPLHNWSTEYHAIDSPMEYPIGGPLDEDARGVLLRLGIKRDDI